MYMNEGFINSIDNNIISSVVFNKQPLVQKLNNRKKKATTPTTTLTMMTRTIAPMSTTAAISLSIWGRGQSSIWASSR